MIVKKPVSWFVELAAAFVVCPENALKIGMSGAFVVLLEVV
jgi:hypothetical protein